MIEYAKCAFENLGRKVLRTVLTALGISIGVASVILIADISQFGTSAISDEMESLGLSGVSITSSQKEPNVVLNAEDLDAIKKMNSVQKAAPVLTQSTKVYVRNSETQAILWGVDSNANSIISIEAIYGRLFNRKEVNTCANVCMVDEAFAQKTYCRKNIVGKKIDILCGGIQQEFTVVGIIKTGTGLLQNIIGSYIPTFVYVPYTTVQQATQRDSFDEIAVKIRSGNDVDQIGNQIIHRLNTLNGTSDGFVSNNLAKQKDGLTHIMDIVTLILSAVGAVSLLVASLSIMTMMLVSVTERTREIGIKKALGATRGAIMLEFLCEAVLISLIGSAFGIAFGLSGSWAASQIFHSAFHVRLDMMGIAVAFALLSGTVFGVYPAYMASRMNPVDALRQE